VYTVQYQIETPTSMRKEKLRRTPTLGIPTTRSFTSMPPPTQHASSNNVPALPKSERNDLGPWNLALPYTGCFLADGNSLKPQPGTTGSSLDDRNASPPSWMLPREHLMGDRCYPAAHHRYYDAAQAEMTCALPLGIMEEWAVSAEDTTTNSMLHVATTPQTIPSLPESTKPWMMEYRPWQPLKPDAISTAQLEVPWPQPYPCCQASGNDTFASPDACTNKSGVPSHYYPPVCAMHALFTAPIASTGPSSYAFTSRDDQSGSNTPQFPSPSPPSPPRPEAATLPLSPSAQPSGALRPTPTLTSSPEPNVHRPQQQYRSQLAGQFQELLKALQLQPSGRKQLSISNMLVPAAIRIGDLEREVKHLEHNEQQLLELNAVFTAQLEAWQSLFYPPWSWASGNDTFATPDARDDESGGMPSYYHSRMLAVHTPFVAPITAIGTGPYNFTGQDYHGDSNSTPQFPSPSPTNPPSLKAPTPPPSPSAKTLSGPALNSSPDQEVSQRSQNPPSCAPTKHECDFHGCNKSYLSGRALRRHRLLKFHKERIGEKPKPYVRHYDVFLDSDTDFTGLPKP